MEQTAEFVQSGSHDTYVSAVLDRLFDPVFSAYVFTTIFFPSGSIYGVNLKYPLYLLLIPLALRRFVQRHPSNSIIPAMMLAIPAFLSLWVLEGVIHGFPASGGIRQYVDIMLILWMCWLTFLFCDGREAGRLRFLRLVLNCEVATSLLKAGIFLYAIARGISVVTVVSALSRAFGVDLMTIDLGAIFGRVQFVSDGLIPICIFIVVRYHDRLKLGYTRALTSVLLLLVSVIVSFSRYFWGYTVVALLIGLLLAKRDRFKAVLIASIAVAVLLSLPVLYDLYQLRFSEEVAGSSDSVRVDQKVALQEFFLEAPIFGHGFGSYSTTLIRNADAPHGYEMQMFALAGQTGIVGMTFFVVLLAWYYRRLFLARALPMPDRLGILALLLFWLVAGLYNPLLESAVASLSYASLATMAALAEKEQPKFAIVQPLV